MCGDSALRFGWLTTCWGTEVVVVELLGVVVVVVGGVGDVVDCAAAVPALPACRMTIAQTLAPPIHRSATQRGTRVLARLELIGAPRPDGAPQFTGVSHVHLGSRRRAQR
jgi:hypothetical protein